MNKKETITILAYLGTLYKHEEFTEAEVDIWLEALKDLPFRVVQQAAKNVIRTREYNTMPMPASLRRASLELCGLALPSDAVAWSQVHKAMKIHGRYFPGKARASMHPVVWEAINSQDWYSACCKRVDMVHNIFMQTYKQVKATHETDQLTLQEGNDGQQDKTRAICSSDTEDEKRNLSS